MKKVLLFLAITVSTMLSTAWAYDFSAISSSGHILYYEIISGTTNVGIVRPGSDSTYNNYISGNVVIPATVSYNGTTYNVTKLITVSNYGSFESCTGLTSVNIPNSVTSIGESAFRNCTGLTSVTIPNSVTSIGNYAFRSCTSLTTLNFNAINCSDFSYSVYPFINCPISTINIGDSVQRIPAYFAYYKSSLTSLTIPNSVTSIGEYAFSGCSGLTTLNFNAVNCRNFSSSNHPFSDCPISTINIGDSVQRIPAYFAYKNNSDHINSSLTSLTIGNSVTTIVYNAFYGCIGLTSVTIPNSVTTIGSSAFYFCKGLTSVTIPNSVTTIEYNAFYGCTGLTSVSIGNSVTSVEETAFNNCTSLTTLNFNAINCSDFSYSEHPFINCPISTITIGNSVQRIPAYFVYNKTAISEIIIPNGVTSIGNSAFYGCSGLDTIIIPNGITTIEKSSFENCNNLAYAVIGKNMSSIGNKAFYGCNNLHNVKSLASFPPTLGSNIFSATAILKVPCGSAAYYSAPAAKWGEYFISIEEICDNITITVISANENMGTVSGSGEYLFGSEVTITATPKQGYRFVSWNDGNTENPRTIVVEAEATYIATFEEEIGIETASELDELRLYPNPTSGTITFNSTDISKVEVMDAMGRMVAVYNDSYIIDLSKLNKGYYTLRVTTDRGVAIRKVVRN